RGARYDDHSGIAAGQSRIGAECADVRNQDVRLSHDRDLLTCAVNTRAVETSNAVDRPDIVRCQKMISGNTRGEMGAPRFQPRPPSEIVKRPEAEDNIAESRWDGGFLRRRVMEGTVHHIMMDFGWRRSEEHTSELQSRVDLVCRL